MKAHISSLADVTDFILDGTHGSPKRTDTGIPVLSAQNVVNGVLNYATDRFTSDEEYAAFAKRVSIKRSDVLLTIVGTIGRAAVVDHVKPAVFQRSVAILRPRAKTLDARYLYHMTQSPDFIEQARKFTKKSTQAGIYLGNLKKIEIPLPPLSEQKRIAAILDKADQQRQKRRQAIMLLDSLTQSIFLEMFADPMSNPKGFIVRELQEIVDPDRKITYGILMPGPDVQDGVPYVRVIDMRDGLVLVDQLRRTTSAIAKEYRRSSLRTGDLLISIRGHVGRLAITPPQCEGANITQDTARLAIADANPLYVSALLSTSAAQHWMAQRTKGVAVRGINLGDLKKFPVMLPPRSEQNDFAEQVEQKLKVLQLKEAQLNSSESLFSSLQHRAFAGQL
ncbi:restriction endonuclease subunit S [Rhizobium laguerreae]|uniref:Type I restriction modification DNA specificity domain-containing protein n=1 Tax=Rhizobium laguerreae TaxID=1076926 RepID=A0A7Y2R9H0_9HYPH|nr:restriction endonuclease subunit S [Rhizobium laguerreae]NNH66826.1 hypothetical protein [Rhizobium laguerreae]